MGLLSNGTPLQWKDAKDKANHVRKHGIEQFINIYERVKNRHNDILLWGDELEFVLVRFDHDSKTVRLDLSAVEILQKLQKEEHDMENRGLTPEASWKPEYAAYMIEATPGRPYGTLVESLLSVEENMKHRRMMAERYLHKDQFLLAITNFPLLGSSGIDFMYPAYPCQGPVTKSLFIPDEAIAPHARFPTLTKNIRSRRGCKVDINVPVFKDACTQKPFLNLCPEHLKYPEDSDQKALKDHIYMDCMCFGMGCCCLQITFQACNIDEARHLYDQLAVIAPIMLCLTAASPIFRGVLADTDCRWNVISKAVDDRTPAEHNPSDSAYINKSRYDSIDCFISNQDMLKPKYNDLPLIYNDESYKRLKSAGCDELLSKHIAHLFIRDPLVVYSELLDQEDTKSSDHFENIQSTNWQTVRFKPPPPNSPIGWRVEFRSMEIQFTEFENASFSIFIVLLSRAILSFGLNFYIPITKVDENMKRAQARDAVGNSKFFFRQHVFKNQNSATAFQSDHISAYGSPESSFSPFEAPTTETNDHYREMTIDQIFNGKKPMHEDDWEFVGLLPIMRSYLGSMNLDVETMFRLSRYLDLVMKRANGECMTNAAWIRNYVREHKSYAFDSLVSQEVNYDMCQEIKTIVEGRKYPTSLLGEQNCEK